MIEERDKFREKIEAAKEQYFPHGELKILNERLNFLKIRISFKEGLFMDIYCNSANNRTDYALIEHGKRVFGCDNWVAGTTSREQLMILWMMLKL